MGRDKALLDYAGEIAAHRAWRLLDSLCGRAFVSIRSNQMSVDSYSGLPIITDQGAIRGPAAGLLAAWEINADVALLALGVDMPLVDEALLRDLLRSRDFGLLATAFRHSDGTPEPLCTIWEPKAMRAVLSRAQAGDYSLRKLLEVSAVKLLDPPDAGQLVSVNTPEEYERIRDELARRARHSPDNAN